jgi:hypothetical protein
MVAVQVGIRAEEAEAELDAVASEGVANISVERTRAMWPLPSSSRKRKEHRHRWGATRMSSTPRQERAWRSSAQGGQGRGGAGGRRGRGACFGGGRWGGGNRRGELYQL